MNKFITFFDNFLDIMKFNSIVYIYIYITFLSLVYNKGTSFDCQKIYSIEPR